MSYLLSKDGVFPLDGISKPDIYLSDSDFDFLRKNKEARIIFLRKLSSEKIIVERLGVSTKDGLFIKREIKSV